MYVNGFTSAHNATSCSSHYQVIAAFTARMAQTRAPRFKRAGNKVGAAISLSISKVPTETGTWPKVAIFNPDLPTPNQSSKRRQSRLDFRD